MGTPTNQPPTAPPTENDTNDPPPTPQLTNDNPLTDLHGRQRAPLKQLRRCFENLTGNYSSMSGTPDEEVDFMGHVEAQC